MRMRMRVLGAAAALLLAAGCGEKGASSAVGGGSKASFKSIDITGTPFFHYDASLEAVKVVTISFAVKSVQQFVP